MKFFGFEIRRITKDHPLAQALTGPDIAPRPTLTAMVAVSEPPAPPPPPPAKKTQKVKVLVVKREKRNVRKASVRVSFEDGTHFNTLVYGNVMPQHVKHHERSYYTKEARYYDAYADKVFVIDAEENVKHMMQHTVGGHHANFLDNPLKPKQSRAGIPRTLKLIKVVDHFAEVDVFCTEEQELEV